MCITRVLSNADLDRKGVKANSGVATKDTNYGKQVKTLNANKSASNLSQLSTFTCLSIGAITSAVVTLFSLYFPFWLAPEAATKTYFLAFYHYNDPEHHHFDNTAWTYGTDYGLAVVMLYWSYQLFKQRTPNTMPLCQRIWGLTVGYAISVTAGALAHHFYHEMEIRNTWHFRILWTICVGSVTFATQPMGCIASEIAQQFQQHTRALIPQVPDLIWRTQAITTTAVCAMGWFSYQRPACDIFIAGITQFPTSFYMMAVLWQIKSDRNMAAYLNPKYQWMCILSFIANAPLLPIYPLLVQYTDWSLAQVNTFLHTWLLITWSMQAISLTHIQKAIAILQQEPPKAVPLVAAKKES